MSKNYEIIDGFLKHKIIKEHDKLKESKIVDIMKIKEGFYKDVVFAVTDFGYDENDNLMTELYFISVPKSFKKEIDVDTDDSLKSLIDSIIYDRITNYSG